jgi:hypothetical protein
MRNELREAWDAVGGLSETSKMPCLSYGLPTRACRTGSRMAKVEGSVCGVCYAKGGFYAMFPDALEAQERRLRTIKDAKWVENMARLIQELSPKWFRWHDSGDLQSVRHLEKVVEVCNLTPRCVHSLPTKEHRMVIGWMERNQIPTNLVIGLSGLMVDGRLPLGHGLQVRGVTRDARLVTCPVKMQGGECLACRKCWEKDVSVVMYGLGVGKGARNERITEVEKRS